MNYLLFVYYTSDVNDSDNFTNEIATRISEQISSNEVKFMYGDRHAILHFASKLDITEMAEWVNIINDELECFQYFLVPKPRTSESNMPKDNLEHLLSLRKSKPTPPKIKYDFKPNDDNSFMDLADILLKFKRPEVCNMTLDELLDKMVDQGVDSLTESEKQKLDEYSKTL